MSNLRTEGEPLRILTFWWMLELFSPQTVPKPTPRATRPSDRQVVTWQPGKALPWETLAPPKPLGTTRRVWQHTVYLGIYELEATYGALHRAFGEDADAYDEGPGGRSACAGLLVDHDGRIVPDSAVLSSALWAVARIHNPGPQDPHWSDGFDNALTAFTDAVDGHEGDRRGAVGSEKPPPCDSDSLQELVRIAHARAGIDGVSGLATDHVVIDSVAVSARRADESSDSDFLNSFYLHDLAVVRDEAARGNAGAALTSYLTSDGALQANGRVDVVEDPGVVEVGTTIERLPKGRWPSRPEHPMALSQQFAVNHALNDLSAGAGLMGVNGPPGTGKTTMLRDILAGNVVERALRLAALARPEDAFTDITHRWTTDDYPRVVRQLRPELTGFEMVVASSNNAAVENVTVEIPTRNAVEQPWRDTADYFADIATEMLRASSREAASKSDVPPTAWGLVAARLGKKRNRSVFHSAFWFDELDPKTKTPAPDSIPRMQTRLTRWRDGRDPHKTWPQARNDFTRAVQRVDSLLSERRCAQARLQQFRQIPTRDHAICIAIDQMRQRQSAINRDLTQHRDTEQRTETALTQARSQYDRHLRAKPGALETVVTLGRAVRDWRTHLEPLAQALRAAERDHQRDLDDGRRLYDALDQIRVKLETAENELSDIREAQRKLRIACADDENRYGDAYPGQDWTGDRRELRAPWLDEELDTARSELFLAALQLHQDFLANAADDMLSGLRAASEVVAGDHPHRLHAEKLRAAWQLFFLAVPLVSTTFASAGRMFGGIGPEAIGWLLIDEAGQASPQYAVGAIWRARRVVAVGDPLQLEPVVTIPRKAQRDIAGNYGVSPTWIPPKASVQTLADRVARVGTTLKQSEEHVWVSAPLRAHRRCDNPMFNLCNQIAYNGIMVNGVHRDLTNLDKPDLFDRIDPDAPLIAPSHWADEPADTPGSHLQENQIERLEKALTYLASRGIDHTQIIAISPFRAVADRLTSLTAFYPGLRAGTIHTAQGREAPVVILVLGGDPNSDGAKAWAASRVNLVNVAASRAQRRLYVIGDRTAWAKHNHFRQLSAALQ